MTLAVRASLTDVEALCGYLLTKPTGATIPEAKAVLDPGILDPRKVGAIKSWNLIEDSTGKMRLTDRGRGLAKDKGVRRSKFLREVLIEVPAYMAIIERAVHRSEFSIPAAEVAAHWHQHFHSEVSDSEEIINQQAISFFQIAEGADLGRMVMGRRGQPTRFEFDEANARGFVETSDGALDRPASDKAASTEDRIDTAPADTASPTQIGATPFSAVNKRVFITHGKNKKILDQVKEIVTYGGFEPIVAAEREGAAKPVPEKVMADMRTCAAAVIHVAVDEVLLDKDGNERPQINGNVLIEIGAAMALYPGYKFILLVEEGLKLPSNLQGLYECRYTGGELSGGATMKLLKSFNEFKSAG
ncbi:MAG: TIR domain-containing protein [Hyphomicrobiaceae bacterium]